MVFLTTEIQDLIKTEDIRGKGKAKNKTEATLSNTVFYEKARTKVHY